MKTLNKLMILFLIIGFVQTGNIEAQSWKDLKNKAKKLKVNKKKTTPTKTNTTTTTKTKTYTKRKTSSSSNIEEQRRQRMQNANKSNKTLPKDPALVEANKYYHQMIRNVELWKKSFRGPWDEHEIATAEFLPKLRTRMANDVKKYPGFLMLYPKELKKETSEYQINKDSYQQYKDFNMAAEDADPPANSRKFVEFYKLYCYWRHSMDKKAGQALAEGNNAINKAAQAPTKDKTEEAQSALRYCKALKIMYPDNPSADDLVVTAEATLNKAFESIKHILTGKMHKLHYKELVGYNEKPVIGSENETSLTNVIDPSKPFYFVGYFADIINNLESKSEPYLIWKFENNKSIYGSQPMYWTKAMESTFKKQSYYVFNLFPKIEDLNYKSHIEYKPHLNMIKWLTQQMPGEYPVTFSYNSLGIQNDNYSIVKGKFILKLTRENINELKILYEKLHVKKLSTVKFNNRYGCKKASVSQLSGKDILKEYGELIKFTLKTSGKVMNKWPNENTVNTYFAHGWAVLKRPDGRYRTMGIKFRRSPSTKKWSLLGDGAGAEGAGLHLKTANSSFSTEETGFIEILKENINKCEAW